MMDESDKKLERLRVVSLKLGSLMDQTDAEWQHVLEAVESLDDESGEVLAEQLRAFNKWVREQMDEILEELRLIKE
jgi:hypothetical protein